MRLSYANTRGTNAVLLAPRVARFDQQQREVDSAVCTKLCICSLRGCFAVRCGRAASRSVMAGCLCKRGKCKTCKTRCPRCQCTCDGIDIALKMSNVRGKHLPKTPPPVRPKRAAATDAAKAITKQTAVMDVDEPLEQGMGLG